MTKDYKAKIEAAAEEYERRENETGYYERIKEDFIAGAQFVLDNPPKEITDLVKALLFIGDQTTDSDIRVLADDVLAEYNKMKEGK